MDKSLAKTILVFVLIILVSLFVFLSPKIAEIIIESMRGERNISEEDQIFVPWEEIDEYEKDIEEERSYGKVHLIEITSKGFVPNILEINQGDLVTFINLYEEDIRPATIPYPKNDGYPNSHIDKCNSSQDEETFDACRNLSIGEEFSFMFLYKGEWDYYNYLEPGNDFWEGTIIVR